MEIYGTKNWNDKKIRYDQTNNIIENVFMDLKNAGKLSFWLESCNVEMTACLVEAVGADWNSPLPIYNNRSFMGHGDQIFNFLNSPIVKPHLIRTSPTILENEFMENLAFAVGCLSSARAKVHHFPGPEILPGEMRMMLARGSGVGLSYETDYGSGHFIAVVAFSEASGRFICYDSWKDNKHCKKDGVQEEYPDAFFISRCGGHRSNILEVWK